FANGIEIDCYVAIMEYIPGRVLKDILNTNDILPANKIAQIAIDLFRILDVLRLKQKNHNDLHAENIIVADLPSDQRRANEVEGRIRVIAIDIGSLTSENKAGD